jgi:hypothetical protein
MSFLTSAYNQIGSLGKFWQEKTYHQIFRWNLIFIGGQLLLLFFKFNSLPPQVPFYYSLPWGEYQLASASTLFILPMFSIILLLIDHLLATFFLNHIRIFSHILLVASLTFSGFSLITLYHIINIIS